MVLRWVETGNVPNANVGRVREALILAGLEPPAKSTERSYRAKASADRIRSLEEQVRKLERLVARQGQPAPETQTGILHG